MGFLAKLGGILLKVTEIAAGIAPIASSSFPSQAGPIQVVSHDLAQIAQIVVEIETMGQVLSIAGPQKLQAAAPLVAQIILQSTLLANRKIADPAGFQKGCGEIAGGLADILNALKDDIDTQSKT